MTETANPLSKYYRQPGVYIKLPSGGKYFSEGAFQPTANGEIPVLPMTAKDELNFKTPDALLNGQATVDVIQSCVPNIKDAWQVVNHDVDTILLAIRIATFGENMDIEAPVPVTNEMQTHSVNLPGILETLAISELKDEITTKSGFKIKVAPLTYKDLTKNQLAAFEQQKIYATVSNSQLGEDEKSLRFIQSFRKLSELNFEVLVESLVSITTPDGNTTTDKAQIKDFFDNATAKITEEIQDALAELRLQGSIKPMKVKATEEQIKAGVPATYEVPITFDNANFFV
jgi:hypothetical protein